MSPSRTRGEIAARLSGVSEVRTSSSITRVGLGRGAATLQALGGRHEARHAGAGLDPIPGDEALRQDLDHPRPRLGERGS